jgi:hypothetical protein
MLPKVTALRCVQIASRGQPSTSLRLCGSRVCQKYRTKLRRELRPDCSRRSFAKFLSIFRRSVSSLRRMVCTKCGAVGAGRAADASYVFLALERNAVGCPPAGAKKRRLKNCLLTPHRPFGHRIGSHDEGLVTFENAFHVREDLSANSQVRLVVGRIRFLGATHDHGIVSGEQIAMMTGEKILQVGLRRQQHQLSFDRMNQFVPADP